MNLTTIFETSSSLLIIKPRAIGDVLLSIPVLNNLKQQFPKLHIDFLCEQFASDVVAGNPNVREVISFNKKKDSSLSIIANVRRKKYDIVIDLFGNPRTALITRLSGAQHRIGFPFRGRAYAYNHLVSPRGGDVHNVDFNLDVLRHFDIPISNSEPNFFIDDSHKKFAQEWIKINNLDSSVLVGINPSGGWSAKKWKQELFAQLADKIFELKKYQIVLFWGPGEEKDVENIASTMKSKPYSIPKTSLKEMGALLERCSYLISNDSGPMHIAASLGVPTLGIYGPTSPKLQGPYGKKNLWVRNEDLDCLECNLTSCPIGNICMSDLSVDRVFQSFQKLVHKNQ